MKKFDLALVAMVAGLMAPVISAHAQTAGITDNEILLGSSVDLTGPVASIGVPMKAGFEIAADVINEAGGIHGRKIKVLVEDNGYDPKRAILAVQKLTTSDRVFGVIGLLGSAITQISLPITSGKGVPMLFPAAPIRVVYDPPQKLSFGLVTGYDLQMSAAASYAYNELGKRKFCMMYQDDESGEQTLAGVERRRALVHREPRGSARHHNRSRHSGLRRPGRTDAQRGRAACQRRSTSTGHAAHQSSHGRTSARALR